MIPAVTWGDYERVTAKTVRRQRSRPCTQLKLAANGRADPGKCELFLYARRETTLTSYWETALVAVLILCSWVSCVLVLFK
jgi:hypothetical protein